MSESISYLDIRLDAERISKVSNLGLAHIGDCVYELMVRSYLVYHGASTAGGLHKNTVRFVSAPAQAEAVERIKYLLTDAEMAIYKRGRNSRVNSVPKNAKLSQYHAATGLETLFGYLYLTGEKVRLDELFSKIMEN